MCLEPPPDPDLSAPENHENTLYSIYETLVLTHLNIHFWMFNILHDIVCDSCFGNVNSCFPCQESPIDLREREEKENREEREEKETRKEEGKRRKERKKEREDKTENREGRERGREAGAGWYATVADTKCVMRVCVC